VPTWNSTADGVTTTCVAIRALDVRAALICKFKFHGFREIVTFRAVAWLNAGTETVRTHTKLVMCMCL